MNKFFWLLSTIIIIIILIFVFIFYIKEYFTTYGEKITERDLYCGSYFGEYNQKKIGTPANWVHSLSGTKSACWHDPIKWVPPIACGQMWENR